MLKGQAVDETEEVVPLRQRLALALPLLVAIVALALVAPSPLAAPSLAFALAAAVLIGPRLPADKATQRLASLVVLVLVIAVVRAAGLPARSDKLLGAFAFGMAVAPLVLAILRLVLVRVEWGANVTSALAFVSVMATGSAKPGPAYGALVAMTLAAVLVAQRASDPARARRQELPKSAAPVAAIIVGLACLLAVSAALVASPLTAYVNRRIERSFENWMVSRSAFSDSMKLERETGLRQNLYRSDRIALRVAGPSPSLLRGVVLDRYEGTRWVREGSGEAQPLAIVRGRLVGPDVVEVKKVGDASDRVFLPFATAAIGLEQGSPTADAHGVVRMPREEADATVWFRVGPRAVAPVSPNGPIDVHVLRELRAPLQSLASQWAAGATTPEEALSRIEWHLKHEFAYALDHKRQTHLDPIIDFLFMNREGHCEYFASAMALLARSVGIPARVVTGYRVSERNPYLGHYVVRDRNAHAWVEAWLPERGWTTYDPTPPSELFGTEEQRGATAFMELLAAGAGRIQDFLAARTVGELAVAAVLGVVLFAVVRRFGASKREGPRGVPPALSFSAVPDAWERLERALRDAGLGRSETEPLEAHAARLPAEIATLVHRYGAARYGGVVDSALEHDLAAAAVSLASVRPVAPATLRR